MRAEDVAAAVAVLRKSLRVILFMAIVIVVARKFCVPDARVFVTNSGQPRELATGK
jgi:hypothetical protein